MDSTIRPLPVPARPCSFVEADEIVLPEPQVKVPVRALMQGLTQTTVSDHRAAHRRVRGQARNPLSVILPRYQRS